MDPIQGISRSPSAGSLQQRRTGGKSALPPVNVQLTRAATDQRLGTCQLVNQAPAAHQPGAEEAGSQAGTSQLPAELYAPAPSPPHGVLKPPLPPVSPHLSLPGQPLGQSLEDQDTAPASSEASDGFVSDETVMRHAQLINQIESVNQRHDERERQVEQHHDAQVQAKQIKEAEFRAVKTDKGAVDKAARKAQRKKARQASESGAANGSCSPSMAPAEAMPLGGTESKGTTQSRPASSSGKATAKAGACTRSPSAPCTPPPLLPPTAASIPGTPGEPPGAVAPSTSTHGNSSLIGPPEPTDGVSQSIGILEACKWRVILEHGAMGDVVAVAAFAPGPNGGSSTPNSAPNTPATPAGACGSQGLGMHAADGTFFTDQARPNGPARSGVGPRAGGGDMISGNSFTAPSGTQNLWINNGEPSEPRQPSPYTQSTAAQRPSAGICQGHHGAMLPHQGGYSAPALRIAWDDLTTMRPPAPRRMALPLRRGAPSALWTLLHLFGLRELELYAACRLCDAVSVLATAAFMLALVSQIGITLIHWADVLPWHLAIGAFIGVFCGWLNVAIFLQQGHMQRLFASSAGSLRAPDALLQAGKYDNRVDARDGADSDGGGCGRWRGGFPRRGPPPRCQGVPTRSAVTPPFPLESDSRGDRGAALPYGSPLSHFQEDSMEVTEPPVGITAPFLSSLQRRVRWIVVFLLATAILLCVADWYWLLAVRLSADPSKLLTGGGDGALWVLGVPLETALVTSEYVGWGLLSVGSAIIVSGSFWVPLCCVMSVLDAHVHLAAQLRATVVDTLPSGAHDGALLLAGVAFTHVRLARQTSQRLGIYSAVHLMAFGYVAVGGLVHIGLHGVDAFVVIVVVAAVIAICILLHAFGASDAAFRDSLVLSATSLLQGELRIDVAHVSTYTLATYELVMAEMHTSRSCLCVLRGGDGPSQGSVLVLLTSAALLGVAIQIGSASAMDDQ